MKKYLQISIVLAVLLMAVLFRDLNSGNRKAAAAQVDTQNNGTPPSPIYVTPPPSATGTPAVIATVAPTPTAIANAPPPSPAQAAPPPTATPKPTPPSGGLYKDGSYTGPPANAYYGNVQVQAVVANGKLIDVKFLQYPNHARTSQNINAQVMPWLTQEAIQAQSAHINVISGASATSYAFAQSLNSALAQAK